MKILILKPSSLGDVVHALPVLRHLKRHLPQSRIYWWIDAGLAGLLENDPDLAGILPFDRRGWTAPRNWRAFTRGLRWTRAERFDWVLDLQGLFRSGAFAWLANAPLSVGLDTPREGARGFYDIAVRRPSCHTHAVDWYLEALRVLSVPTDGRFEWMPRRADVQERLNRHWNLPAKRWILVQPGARWENKRWPAEHFATAVKNLAEKHPGHSFGLLGSAADHALTTRIHAAAPRRCLDLSGKLSLPELVEWIRAAELMITNDTGPMHIAAAVGTRVVAPFGPTEPRRTGPYGQLDHTLSVELPCIPCLRPRCHYPRPMECLRALSPERVCALASRLLASAP